MNARKLMILALALLMVGVSSLAEAAPDVGSFCPDFELTTLKGETFRLSENRGKVVFINIWATWCPPCVSEMPEIEKLANAHADELVVLGVSVDDRVSTVEEFLAEKGYTYTIAMDDANYTVANRLFPTYAIPNSIFIDPKGVVTSIEAGAASYATMERRFLDAKLHAELN